MEIIQVEQNTPEWLLARAGIPTASCFTEVTQQEGPRGGTPIGRQTYMYKLAGEIITGRAAVSYTNAAMERGHGQEPEARELYAFASGHAPEQVGFIREDGGFCGPRGCSPDSLIGQDGMLEIKTAEPHVLIKYLEMSRKDPTWYPPEHRLQCQGNLWIAQREWIDLVVYSPGMRLFTRMIRRDEACIREIESAVSRFNAELAQLVERCR